MIERKCPICAKWNKDEKFCFSCGEALDPSEILKLEIEKQDEAERLARANKNDRLQKLIEKARNSKNPLVKFVYYVVFSVSFILMGLGAFFAWMVAWAAG